MAALIAVVAGCGAQPNQTHPSSTWATSYCSALADWLTTVDSISRGFVIEPTQSATTNITDLETVAKQISQASGTLADALARAGRPETANAAGIEQTIAHLSSSVRARSAAAERAAKSNDRAALAGFRRLRDVTAAVVASLSDIESADVTIRQHDAALRRALDASRACRDFHRDVREGTRRGNQ